MTLVTTITHHPLWHDVLEENTLPAIAERKDITDKGQSCCIKPPLAPADIDALRTQTTKLIVTYISPDVEIAQLLEEGKELDEALSMWKQKTLDLLSIHKKQRSEIHLLNLEELTQLQQQGYKNLKNIGWPFSKSVCGVPSSINRVIAAQALIQNDDLSDLASLLFVSSYHLSSKPLRLNLSDTLERYKKSLVIAKKRNKELKNSLETEQLLIQQLFKVQEQLESYYRENLAAKKSISALTRDNKKVIAKAKNLKQEVDELSIKLTRIQSSLMWKATKPLRVFKAKLTGIKESNVRKKDTDLISKSSFFDQKWYLEVNSDVRRSGVCAAEHYLLYGAKEGRNPSQKFDNNWYLNQYPDVAESGLNPLVHFLKYGQKEKRTPSPRYINRNTAIK